MTGLPSISLTDIKTSLYDLAVSTSLDRPLTLAVLFQALADETRLRIFALLRTMELSVGELALVLDQSQPRVSRHVRILAEAGVVDRRREGSWVFCAPKQSAHAEPLSALFESGTGPRAAALFASDRERLAEVRKARSDAAARYFAAHASSWDEIRSLHVAESAVESAITEMLGDRPLGCLLDIGTGTGRMLELLASRADQAIGIDRSSEMLRLARVKLDRAGIADALLRQADMYALPMSDGAADCAVLHQVLHYAHAPAAALGEAARVLRPGGRLLIVDFAAHDHEELRTRDAHARLGFTDEAITRWLAAAGIELDDSRQLPGGALTVALWRAVKPGLVDDRDDSLSRREAA